ncbi:hypothetical protein IJG72_04865 [bacterium]|nr:hypothetical protein [bacterium]
MIKNFAKKIVISLLNTTFTIFIIYWNIISIINAIKTPDADWNQVLTYLIVSAIILLVMWFVSFLKFLRNMLILVLIIVFCGWLYLPNLLPEIGGGMCMNMGSCKQGATVKTVSGKIIINKDTCINNGWIWDEKKSVCKINRK